ncbi:hypothetical protein [Methanolobus sp.]|uniref:hypothetical protein n=1 Tax=Methanolobus sp. TaxID=1874737 RepID=UPI0025D48BA2|nr:hypothetical protein [Methanolobus sp.]
MLNFNGDFNDISVLDYLAIYFIIAIIGNILQHSLRYLFFDRKGKRKQNELIGAFRGSKSISPYINKFDKIKYFNRADKSIIALNIGFFLGFFLPFGSLYLMLWFTENVSKIDLDELLALKIFIYTILLTFLIPTSSLLIMQKRIETSIKKQTILNKATSFADAFTFFAVYILTSFPINLLFLIPILYNWNSIPNKIHFLQMTFMIAITLMVTTPILYIGAYHSFKRKLKTVINKNYGDKYPYLKITTDENKEIQGYILDIFNEKVIKLFYDGSEKIVLWDSVHSVEINNTHNIRQNEEIQRNLYDYI